MRKVRLVRPLVGAEGECGMEGDREPSQVQVCVTCSQGRILGRLEGKLDAIAVTQQLHGAKMETIDTRLRSVENRSAIVGAAAAVLMSLGIDFAHWKLKA